MLIRCDSKYVISLIQDGEHHQRTKHIDVKYFYVRDQQDLGNVAVTHLPGIVNRFGNAAIYPTRPAFSLSPAPFCVER